MKGDTSVKDDKQIDPLPNSTFRYAYQGDDMFVDLDGMLIARRRGRRGKVIRWDQLVPNFWVASSQDYTRLVPPPAPTTTDTEEIA